MPTLKVSKSALANRDPTMPNTVAAILQFLTLTERLKLELRHSWLSDGRQESVAEHSYQMALMVLVLAPHLEHEVDVFKCLRMALVHDLVEAEAGDVPFFEKSERKETKAAREQQAIENLREMLPEPSGSDFYDLWHEFEERRSAEAKFVSALDYLEVQLQHNLASIDSWEEIEYDLVYTKMRKRCDYDSFLLKLCAQIEADGETKMREAGIDVDSIRERLGVG